MAGRRVARKTARRSPHVAAGVGPPAAGGTAGGGTARSAAGAPEAAPAPEVSRRTPCPSSNSIGELHEPGVLSDEEFAASKAKILGT
jgi:hypothetical protein